MALPHARNYDEAIEQLKKVIELEPKFFLAHLLLGMAYEQQGNFSEALREFKAASLLENSRISIRISWIHVCCVGG